MNNFAKELISVVADQISQEVDAWANDDYNSKKEIEEAISYYYSSKRDFVDGYVLAKYLEKNHSYGSNTKLVNILDNVKELIEKTKIQMTLSKLTEVQKRLSAEEIQKLSSKIKIGDSVSVFSQNIQKYITGIIIRVYSSMGKVEVYCSELGHVNPFEENDIGNGDGVCGILVDIDKITFSD